MGAVSVALTPTASIEPPNDGLLTAQEVMQPDKAAALRQAMLNTLSRYPDPRDWAAFFLIGLPLPTPQQDSPVSPIS